MRPESQPVRVAPRAAPVPGWTWSDTAALPAGAGTLQAGEGWLVLAEHPRVVCLAVRVGAEVGGCKLNPTRLHLGMCTEELGRVLGPLPGEGALLPRLSGLSSLSLWSLNTFHEQGSNAAVKSVSLIHPAVELFMHDR